MAVPPAASPFIMPRSLSKTELVDFIYQAITHPGPCPLLVMIMSSTGIRLNESLRLRWSDLIYANSIKSTIELFSQDTKNNHSRSLPVTGYLHDKIALRWVSVCANEKMTPSDYVGALFHGQSSISSRSIQRFTKAVGLTSINRAVNPHMLRHTFATHLLAVSNLEVVRKALGHRRISTTQIYVHPSDDELRSAVIKKDLALMQLEN